jgi:hypothetical protein
MRIGGSSDWISGFGGQRPPVRALRAPADSAVGAPSDPAPLLSRPAADDDERDLFHPRSAAEGVTDVFHPHAAEDGPKRLSRPGTDADASTAADKQSAVDRAATAERQRAARKAAGPPRLTPEQEVEVAELRRRDAEVRAHEAAHAAAAGALGGGASFDYATGPDGRSYAVGGEVPVEMAPGRTPEETIRNAAQLRAAALAPAEPSAQDRAVAAEAEAMEAAARAEIAARSTTRAEASPATATLPSHPAAVEQSSAAPGAGAAAAEQADPAHVIQQLEVEQRSSRAGWRHLHAESGCAICGKAVATYR